MSPDEIKYWKSKIDKLSHIEMCRLWRFAPAGHIYFNVNLPLFKHFNKRYKKFGGMTPEISKRLNNEKMADNSTR